MSTRHPDALQQTNELVQNDAHERRKQQLNQLIQRQLTQLKLRLNPNPVNEREVWIETLDFIPVFGSFSREWMDYGDLIAQMVVFSDKLSSVANTAQSVSHGFSIASLVTYAVDFMSLPVIYTAAFLLGKKPPFEPQRLAKWGLAGLVLTAALMGFLFPAAAPYIAIATTGLMLTIGAVTFVRFFLKKQKFKKELRLIETELPSDQENWEKQAKQFEELLTRQNERLQDPKRLIDDIQEIVDITTNSIDEIRPGLQTKLDRKATLKEIIKTMNGLALFDKTFGLGMTLLALTGVIIGLFFPGPALIMAFVAGTVGTAYLVARVVPPLLKKGWNVIKAKINGSDKLSHDSTEDIQRALQAQSRVEHSVSLETQLDSLQRFVVDGDVEEVFLLSNELLGKLTKEKNTEALYRVINLLAKIELGEEDQEELKKNYETGLNNLDPALTLLKGSNTFVYEDKVLEKMPELNNNPHFKNFLLEKAGVQVKPLGEGSPPEADEEHSLSIK